MVLELEGPSARRALEHWRDAGAATRVYLDEQGDVAGFAQVVALEQLRPPQAEAFRGCERDDVLYRVLDRTYLRPAAKQAVVAEELHMPYGTYRHHLAQAIARLVEVLWQQEPGSEVLPARPTPAG